MDYLENFICCSNQVWRYDWAPQHPEGEVLRSAPISNGPGPQKRIQYASKAWKRSNRGAIKLYFSVSNYLPGGLSRLLAALMVCFGMPVFGYKATQGKMHVGGVSSTSSSALDLIRDSNFMINL